MTRTQEIFADLIRAHPYRSASSAFPLTRIWKSVLTSDQGPSFRPAARPFSGLDQRFSPILPARFHPPWNPAADSLRPRLTFS